MEELEGLLARARALGAVAATTPKDAMRLPLAVREQMEVIGVRMIWRDEAALDALLETV
jgi:tetraacyldisaccharide 4'-kinase